MNALPEKCSREITTNLYTLIRRLSHRVKYIKSKKLSPPESDKAYVSAFEFLKRKIEEKSHVVNSNSQSGLKQFSLNRMRNCGRGLYSLVDELYTGRETSLLCNFP